MPVHIYNCPSGHDFERSETIHDITPKKCPKCGRKAKIGVANTGSPILKEGSGGFYKPTKAETSGGGDLKLGD